MSAPPHPVGMPEPGPRRIAITGASGLIGSVLTRALRARGDSVLRLVRRAARSSEEIPWQPEREVDEPARLEGLDAVLHLAGENLAARRWSEGHKRRLRDSRVLATERLAQSLARLARPPRVLVTASAVGIYGDRGDEWLTEDSEPGVGFLARLARDWEDAAEPARARGIRVVTPRFGQVLAPGGGLLARLMLPFRLGLGGPVGRPGAWWSWVAIDDVVGLVSHAVSRDEVRGPCNVVAPEPVTSAEFARALGRALRRPAVLPVPAWALRLLFGEMADEMLLTSLRVAPRRALAAGYTFAFPRLESALHHLLRKTG